MSLPPSPLDRPATIPVLRRLKAEGVLSDMECETLEWQVRRNLPWTWWLDRGLLVLGSALIVSGVIYFFAHNWLRLTDNDKLGLAAGAVLATLIGATYVGFEKFPGKILLLVASVFVGVFLSVFGQIYQTSTETYEWFTFWALLIFPWVALGRFSALWLLWLVLLNTALFSYFDLYRDFWNGPGGDEYHWAGIRFILLNSGAIVVWEFAKAHRVPWLDRGWFSLLVLTAIYLVAAEQVCIEFSNAMDHHRSNSDVSADFAVYAVIAGLTGWFYTTQRPSLPTLAVATLSTCTFLCFIAGRIILEHASESATGIFFLMGVLILAVFGGGVFFLRRMGAKIAARKAAGR
jgi:uncharacterized membrane protein